MLLAATGILFMNKYPLSGVEYATRRAINDVEAREWVSHLKQMQVSIVLMYRYKFNLLLYINC